MSLPHPILRRSVTIPVAFALGILTTALTPAAIVILAIVDLLTGHARGRWARVWLVVVGGFWVEMRTIVRSTFSSLWFIRRRDTRGQLTAGYRVEYHWCRLHLRNLARWAKVRVEFDNVEEFGRGPAIAAGRHASHVDALAPLIGVASNPGAQARYTLKQELQWSPAMDLVGNATPNIWIDRAPTPGSPTLAHVEALATGIGSSDLCVIFPEGTFHTAARQERALARIADTQPDLAPLARQLRHMLPPRPAGFLALLRGAPAADIVLFANVGLESGGEIREILDHMAEPQTIRVRAWRHERSTLPYDEDAITRWLLERWIEMDNWIDDQLQATSARENAAA